MFFFFREGITFSPEHIMCTVAPKLSSSLWMGPGEPGLPHVFMVFLPLRITLLRVQTVSLRIETALAMTHR